MSVHACVCASARARERERARVCNLFNSFTIKFAHNSDGQKISRCDVQFATSSVGILYAQISQLTGGNGRNCVISEVCSKYQSIGTKNESTGRTKRTRFV